SDLAGPNDDCGGVLEPLSNGANLVYNLCSIDGMVGFEYTVTNGVIVNITVAPGTVANPTLPNFRLNDPCVGTVLSPPFTCLTPGDIIYIQGGNSNACPQYGDFTITVSDMDNGIANDVCSGIQPQNNFGADNVLNCGEMGMFTGNAAACPDAEATCFGAMTEGVWYSFTVDANLPNFSITGPGSYELFEGTDCASLTSLGCSVTGLASDPATTYFLLVGPTGTVTVDADQNAPVNDDCAGSSMLTTAGLTNQTNVCADAETINGCNANDDNVVWYTFMMPAGMENATITVTPNGGSGITDPALE